MEVRPGRFLRSELDDFTAWLWGDWKVRDVPAGISQELARESAGICPVCKERNDVPERAHINRKGRELGHYSQHPHNLMACCPTCHGRYDRLGTLAPETMRYWKTEYQNRMLAEVDRRIASAKQLSSLIDTFKEAVNGPDTSSEGVLDALAAIVEELGSGSLPESTLSAAAALRKLAASQTRNTLAAGLLEVGARTIEEPDTEVDDPVWEAIHVTQVGECTRQDGSFALVESMTCAKCGRERADLYNAEPAWVGDFEEGVQIGMHDDGEGGLWLVECECGSTHWDVVFQPFCSYCEHMWSKVMDDER